MQNMQFILNISHTLFILYGIMLGVLGNITYRAEKKLPIKPIWLRILWGCFSLAVYLTVLQKYIEIKELNLLNAFPIFLIGFMSEHIAKFLPDLFDKWKKNKVGDSNEKK